MLPTVYERHSQRASVLSEISPTLCDDSFLIMLQSKVQVTLSSTNGYGKLVIDQLVKNWSISIEAIVWTTNATTQNVVKTVI